MMDPDNIEDDVSIAVDGSQSHEFPPPPAWHVDEHIVHPLTVRVHTRPISTEPTSTAAPDLPSLLTLPDIAQADTAFSPFFQYCRHAGTCPQLDVAAAHYHLTMPGHTTGASTLAAEDDVSIAAIIGAIDNVFDRFRLRRVVAFGVGLGATAFLMAAAAHPRRFSGLVLISPLLAPMPILEWIARGAETLLQRGSAVGLSSQVKERLLGRWLSDASREEKFGIAQDLEKDVDRLNSANVIRMLAEDMWRADATATPQSITAQVLLVTGKESSLRHHVEDYFPSFKPQSTSWLDIVDVGSLAHDECPDKVATAVSLFLQGIPGFT